MLRVLVFLALFCSLIYAKIQNVELLANDVKKNGNVVVAKGDVLVYSQEYLITANKALYNNKTEILELFGNVNVISEVNEALKSDYVKLDLKSQKGNFKPFFTYEDQSKMWLECESAKSDKKFYITKNTIASSCNVQNPDWKLGFEEGELNKKSRFLFLKNVVFYIRDVPVFYLPYFAISTDTTRKTGLLIPTVGFGTRSGFFYKQPFYVAEQVWWDLEISPQIRTDRGFGTYGILRFVDTKYSKGELSGGVFRDKDSYVNKEQLKHKKHYGYGLKYENSKILERYLKGTDDGLWLDLTYLNDIDYLNLKEEDSQHDSLVTSKLNYFITGKHDYFGLYTRYYIDTKKLNNDTTLQELPTLHYHRYLNNLYFKNLLYSFDVKYHRYTRKEGVRAQQIEADLPITFYTNLFDDFLHFEISENIYATHIKYANSNNRSDTFSRNFHKISLYSDLSKPYDNMYHTIRFGADLIVPSWQRGKIEEDFIKTDKEKKILKANLTQYFYNQRGEKKVKHKLAQTFNFDNNSYKYGKLENELSYFLHDRMYAKSDIWYSFANSRFEKVQTSLYYNDDKYLLDLIHTYTNETRGNKENFITAEASSKYQNYRFFAGLNHSIVGSFSKSWRLGYEFRKKCWNYTLMYKEETSPKLTSFGSGSVKRKGFYLAFEIFPIGGTEYDFSKETSLAR